MINIRGINKAELIAGLFNRSIAPRGVFFDKRHERPMTAADVASYRIVRISLETNNPIDHLRGRPIKMNVAGDQTDPTHYDALNGFGAAAWVVTDILERQPLVFKEAVPMNDDHIYSS